MLCNYHFWMNFNSIIIICKKYIKKSVILKILKKLSWAKNILFRLFILKYHNLIYYHYYEILLLIVSFYILIFQDFLLILLLFKNIKINIITKEFIIRKFINISYWNIKWSKNKFFNPISKYLYIIKNK